MSSTSPSLPRLEHHTEASDLEASTLEALLERGLPRERIWAAWELGLRRGETWADQLRTRLEDESHAGVRRHFAIMLAGWGEVHALRELAFDDSDPRVRATACRYLCQRADEPERVSELCDHLECEEHPRVRATLLSHLPRTETIERRLASLLESGGPRLQQAIRARYETAPDREDP